jgi:hypothetical protein
MIDTLKEFAEGHPMIALYICLLVVYIVFQFIARIHDDSQRRKED